MMSYIGESFLYIYIEEEGRISSAAFKNSELSVNWARYTSPQKTLQGYNKSLRLASIIAKIPREKNQDVTHNPLKDNYSHSRIIGKKTNSIAKFLANNSKLVTISE